MCTVWLSPHPRASPIYIAVGSGCCDSGCGSSCCPPGRDWRSWRRRVGESDCPWWGWGIQEEEAETWDQAGMRVAVRCGFDSGLWMVGGGCAEPAAQPAGCGVLIPSLLSKFMREKWLFMYKQLICQNSSYGQNSHAFTRLLQTVVHLQCLSNVVAFAFMRLIRTMCI